MSKPPSRIPALDGLRAISILMVMVSHTNGTHGAFKTSALSFVDLGRFGVRVFFVISGFLITTLLLAEREKHGRISIKDFYIRRVFRIFPAFYAFLAVILVVQALGFITLMPGDALFAATYTTNFHEPRAWWLGHLWSLSVEEQFYLLWPALMVFLGNRGATFFAVASVLTAPLMRVGVWVLLPAYRVYIDEAFPTIFDAIATGCVLASIRPTLTASTLYQRFQSSPLFVLVPLAAVGAAAVPRVSFDLLVGQTITNVAIALTIDWCVRRPESAPVRFLELRPFVWIGTLSYSLYLWQQPLLNRHSDAFANRFPINLIGAFVLGSLSYYLIEKPVLRLRSRLKL